MNTTRTTHAPVQPQAGFTLVEMLACPPKPWRRGSRAAFTLVEMLVVVAILAILMAMMIPAAGMILRRAKVSTARGDAGIVVTALTKYNAEYNRWPAFYQAGPADQNLTDNVWVDAMSPPPGGAMPASNPKRLMFFEPSGGVLGTEVPYVGSFVDPWGVPFEYQVDLDGDGQIAHPNGEGPIIRGRVIAWSAGPDRMWDTWEDNVPSWE